MGWGGGVMEDGLRMEWGDAGGRGMCKKSRQAVGTVPGSCQLSALTVSLHAQEVLRINTPVIL